MRRLLKRIFTRKSKPAPIPSVYVMDAALERLVKAYRAKTSAESELAAAVTLTKSIWQTRGDPDRLRSWYGNRLAVVERRQESGFGAHSYTLYVTFPDSPPPP